MLFLFVILLYEKSALAESDTVKTDAQGENKTAAEKCARGLGYPKGAVTKERSIASEINFCEEHYMMSCCSEKERAVRFCSGAYRNDVPRFEVATGDRLGRCYDGVPAGKRLKQSKQQKFTQRSTRSRNFFEQVL